MKNVQAIFADNVLSKNEMKNIKGGGSGCHVEVDSGYGGCADSMIYDVEGPSGANMIIAVTDNVTGWRYWCD